MFGSIGAAFFSAYPQIRGAGGFSAGPANFDARRSFQKAAYIAIAISVVVGISVFVLSTRINPPDEVRPLNVPSGYTPISWRPGELGLAIPETWAEEPAPLVAQFASGRPDEFLSLIVQKVPESELQQVEDDPNGMLSALADYYESTFQGIRVTGAPIKRSHQGRAGFVMPVRWTGTDGFTTASTDGYPYYILDYKYSRMVLLTYADSDQLERIISTLNLN